MNGSSSSLNPLAEDFFPLRPDQRHDHTSRSDYASSAGLSTSAHLHESDDRRVRNCEGRDPNVLPTRENHGGEDGFLIPRHEERPISRTSEGMDASRRDDHTSLQAWERSSMSTAPGCRPGMRMTDTAVSGPSSYNSLSPPLQEDMRLRRALAQDPKASAIRDLLVASASRGRRLKHNKKETFYAVYNAGRPSRLHMLVSRNWDQCQRDFQKQHAAALTFLNMDGVYAYFALQTLEYVLLHKPIPHCAYPQPIVSILASHGVGVPESLLRLQDPSVILVWSLVMIRDPPSPAGRASGPSSPAPPSVDVRDLQELREWEVRQRPSSPPNQEGLEIDRRPGLTVERNGFGWNPPRTTEEVHGVLSDMLPTRLSQRRSRKETVSILLHPDQLRVLVLDQMCTVIEGPHARMDVQLGDVVVRAEHLGHDDTDDVNFPISSPADYNVVVNYARTKDTMIKVVVTRMATAATLYGVLRDRSRLRLPSLDVYRRTLKEHTKKSVVTSCKERVSEAALKDLCSSGTPSEQRVASNILDAATATRTDPSVLEITTEYNRSKFSFPTVGPDGLDFEIMVEEDVGRLHAAGNASVMRLSAFSRNKVLGRLGYYVDMHSSHVARMVDLIPASMHGKFPILFALASPVQRPLYHERLEEMVNSTGAQSLAQGDAKRLVLAVINGGNVSRLPMTRELSPQQRSRLHEKLRPLRREAISWALWVLRTGSFKRSSFLKAVTYTHPTGDGRDGVVETVLRLAHHVRLQEEAAVWDASVRVWERLGGTVHVHIFDGGFVTVPDSFRERGRGGPFSPRFSHLQPFMIEVNSEVADLILKGTLPGSVCTSRAPGGFTHHHLSLSSVMGLRTPYFVAHDSPFAHAPARWDWRADADGLRGITCPPFAPDLTHAGALDAQGLSPMDDAEGGCGSQTTSAAQADPQGEAPICCICRSDVQLTNDPDLPGDAACRFPHSSSAGSRCSGEHPFHTRCLLQAVMAKRDLDQVRCPLCNQPAALEGLHALLQRGKGMVRTHRFQRGLNQPLFNTSMDFALLEFQEGHPEGAQPSDSSSVDSFVTSPDSEDIAGGAASSGGHPGRPPRRTNLSSASSGERPGHVPRRARLSTSPSEGHTEAPPPRANLSAAASGERQRRGPVTPVDSNLGAGNLAPPPPPPPPPLQRSGLQSGPPSRTRGGRQPDPPSNEGRDDSPHLPASIATFGELQVADNPVAPLRCGMVVMVSSTHISWVYDARHLLERATGAGIAIARTRSGWYSVQVAANTRAVVRLAEAGLRQLLQDKWRHARPIPRESERDVQQGSASPATASGPRPDSARAGEGRPSDPLDTVTIKLPVWVYEDDKRGMDAYFTRLCDRESVTLRHAGKGRMHLTAASNRIGPVRFMIGRELVVRKADIRARRREEAARPPWPRRDESRGRWTVRKTRRHSHRSAPRNRSRSRSAGRGGGDQTGAGRARSRSRSVSMERQPTAVGGRGSSVAAVENQYSPVSDDNSRVAPADGDEQLQYSPVSDDETADVVRSAGAEGGNPASAVAGPLRAPTPDDSVTVRDSPTTVGNDKPEDVASKPRTLTTSGSGASASVGTSSAVPAVLAISGSPNEPLLPGDVAAQPARSPVRASVLPASSGKRKRDQNEAGEEEELSQAMAETNSKDQQEPSLSQASTSSRSSQNSGAGARVQQSIGSYMTPTAPSVNRSPGT